MKASCVLAGLLALAASPALASPKDVTRSEVATYRNAVASGCQAQGRQLKHPQERVLKQCKCVVDTLGKLLKDDEWKRATWYAQQGMGREESEVFAPHAAALKACAVEAKK